jgi:hypothetical protein
MDISKARGNGTEMTWIESVFWTQADIDALQSQFGVMGEVGVRVELRTGGKRWVYIFPTNTHTQHDIYKSYFLNPSTAATKQHRTFMFRHTVSLESPGGANLSSFVALCKKYK